MADARTRDTSGGTGAWEDPYRSYNFKLQIQGVTRGHFTQCSGLSAEVETIEYREAGAASVVRKLPGRVRYGDVTLRYGLTDSTQLWDWFMSGVEGHVQRKNVSVVMLDNDGITPVLQWDLIDAWVARWRGAPLDASGQETAIETMTLVFETLERS